MEMMLRLHNILKNIVNVMISDPIAIYNNTEVIRLTEINTFCCKYSLKLKMC